MTTIAIVGDFKPGNASHAATNEALDHCAAALRLPLKARWVGTEELAGPDGLDRLKGYAGFWIAPASPYRSMAGALAAIRAARESGIPLLGTCGGFQHIVLEYARNVLGIAEAEHEESAPQAQRLFITKLACSLVGRRLTLRLEPESRLARFYGRTEAHEQYHCNFGVNPESVPRLRSSALRIVASDAEGVVRAVELDDHPFYIGTLFLPQLTSTPSAPHPLICGFITAAAARASG